MARMAGSEDKPKGKSPDAVDHNAVVTEGSYLQAVKEIGAATAAVLNANTARKQIRKKWKATGISLGALDRAVRMVEWERQEVRETFATEKRYAEWLGLPVQGVQADAFKGLSDDDIQAREWHAVGRSYSRAGKPGKPPEECSGEFIQAFMRGFNAEDEDSWADGGDVADKPEEVAATPGEGEAPAPVASEEASFTQADPTPPPGGAGHVQADDQDGTATRGYFDQPDWAQLKMGEDPAEWFADQKRAFRDWYDGLPAGVTVLMSHPGVLAAFRAAILQEKGAAGAKLEDIPEAEEVSIAPVSPPALAMSAKDVKAAARAAKAKGQTVQ